MNLDHTRNCILFTLLIWAVLPCVNGQNVGIGTENPSHTLHVRPLSSNPNQDPLRLEGLQAFDPITDSLILVADPTLGIIRTMGLSRLGDLFNDSGSFYSEDGTLSSDRILDLGGRTLTFDVGTSNFLISGRQGRQLTLYRDGGIFSPSGISFQANNSLGTRSAIASLEAMFIDNTTGNESARISLFAKKDGQDIEILNWQEPGFFSLKEYGGGNLVGGYAYLLGININGNIVEVDPNSFGGGNGGSTWASLSGKPGGFADNIDDVDDADNDPNNEKISSLSLVNNELIVSEGGSSLTLDLSSLAGGGLSNSWNNITEKPSGFADNIDDVDDADNDSTNELISNFSLTGSLLNLTEGGVNRTVDLSALGGNEIDDSLSIYNSNGTLTEERIVNLDKNKLTFTNGGVFAIERVGNIEGVATFNTADAALSINNALFFDRNEITAAENLNIGVNNGEVRIRQNNNGVAIDVAEFRNTGQISFEEYGQGNFQGSQAFILGVAANGDLVEISSIGNGNNTDNIYNGDGTLIANRNVNLDGKNLTFSGGGKVGIGTTNPAGALHIFETTGSTPSPNTGTFILQHGDIGGQSSIVFRSRADANTDFGYISFQDDGSGNGTTGENGLLTIGIENDQATAWQDDIALLASGYVGVHTNTPGFDLDVNGNFNYSGNLTNISDIRFKKNIQPLRGSLEKLVLLAGKSYEMRTETFPERRFSDGEQMGLIAQEVEEIFPELVSEDLQGYKSVNYIGLIPVMIEAIKALKEENEQLKDQLEAQHSKDLEARLVRLESLLMDKPEELELGEEDR